MAHSSRPAWLAITLAGFLVACGGPASEALEKKYFETLDGWVARRGPFDEIQKTVVETCGKLVMLDASTTERVAFTTTRREDFDLRVDVCAKVTVNRVHPQPEFENKKTAAIICDESKMPLFSKLCQRSGLR